MANVFIENATLQNIANAIRNKTGKTEKILPAEIPVEIESIQANSGGYEQGFEDGFTKGKMPLYYANISSLDSMWDGVTFPENTELVIHLKNSMARQYRSFRNAKNLKTLKLIADNIAETSAYFNGFASGCSHLELIDLTEYNRKINGFSNFATGSGNLKSILGALEASECKIFSDTFSYAPKLEDVEFVPNTIKVSINFSHCPLLSDKSIQSIIDGLADLTGQTSQTLSLKSTVGAKLTDTQKATITAKNWTLVY